MKIVSVTVILKNVVELLFVLSMLFVTSLSEIWYRKSAVISFVRMVIVKAKALLKGVNEISSFFT